MTDITDQDRRVAHEWAASIDPERKCWSYRARAIARVILATVDAPPPTIADEIMDLGRALDQYGHFDALGIDVAAIADRVAQVEHDLTEARAEVEHLTAVNENLRKTDNYQEFREAFLTVQKGAESNAESLDPADVPPGEAWIVEVDGERRNAVKDSYPRFPWNTVGANNRFYDKGNEDVTLITRLVPAPRVITNTDELEALPHRTVIRDSAGVMFQRIIHGWYQAGDTSVHRSDDNFVCLPVTVLWEPGA